MKNKIFILLYTLLFLFFVSCSSYERKILKKGIIYKYLVFKYKDNQREELGTLYLQKSSSFLSLISPGQIAIKWTYKLKNIDLEETTLATEDGTGYSLHPPRESIFAFTEVPPFPSIHLPPEVGTTQEIELHIIKYDDFMDGFLNGKILKKKNIVKKVIDTTISNTYYQNCYYSVGKNLNLIDELGTYLIETWFTEDKGFILIKYLKPKGEIIELILQ